MRLRRGAIVQTIPPIDSNSVQGKHRLAVSVSA